MLSTLYKYLLKPRLLLTAIIFIYVLLCFALHKGVPPPSSTPYYNYLLDAFFHGRLDLTSDQTYDLSYYQGKWYLYFGPAPILFVLPFYLINGIAASDRLYLLIAATSSIIILSVVLRKAVLFFKISLSPKAILIPVIFFAFSSPLFYQTLLGRISAVYQIIAIFYLLFFLLFYFIFLTNPRRLLYFVLAVIFFHLAWLSRYSLIFYGLLFLFPLWFHKINKYLFRNMVILLTSISLFFISILLLYNFVRFGNPLETGFRYQIGDSRSNEILRSGKIFSLDYIPHNFYYYFLHPVFLKLEKPYIHNLTLEGNSIFFMYPYLLLLVLFLRKNHFLKKQSRFLFLSLFVILSTLFFLLSFFASGWTQLGNRFFLDLMPLTLILLLFVIYRVPLFAQLLLVGYGMVINFVALSYVLKAF